MKGFIFSIEAVMALAIVLIVLGTFYFSTGNYIPRTNTLQIQMQSDEATALYFNEPGQSPQIDANQQYCAKISVYVPASKSFSDKTLCRWAK